MAGAGATAPVIVEVWRRWNAPDKPSVGGQVDLETAEDRISAASTEKPSQSAEEQKASFERILNFNQQFPLRIVVSTLSSPDDQPLRHSITYEEVEAADAVIRVLPRSQRFSTDIKIADDVDYQCSDNLIILGSKRRNRVAADLTQFTRAFGFDFVEVLNDDGQERWGLSFGHQTFVSPFFDQQREYKKDPTYHGGFVDFGLLAKISSPWNNEAKVLLVAGIKALGTLGAGKFLEENGPWLENQVGDSDFAQVIRAVREDPTKDHIFVEPVGKPHKLAHILATE